MAIDFFLEVSGKRFLFSLNGSVREVWIGRGTGNSLPLPDDHGVSKVHSRLFVEQQLLMIEDAGSRNGTYVNQVKIAGPAPLASGDVIQIGSSIITLTILEETAQTPAAPAPKPVAQAGMTCIFSIKDLEEQWRLPEEAGSRVDKLLSEIKSLGVVQDIASTFKDRTEQDRVFHDSVRILLNENKRLGVLQEIASSLLDHNDLDRLFQDCLNLIFTVIPARRGCLMMLENNELQVKAVRALEKDAAVPAPDIIRFSNTIRRLVVEEKSAVLTANVEGDPQLEGAHSIIIQGIKSVLCVPLWNGDRTYGLIYLDSSFHEKTFNENNLRLLTAVANLVTMKIENFLFIQELLQKKAMEKELEFASDVQRFILPAEFPAIPGVESSVFYQSCLQLGGDYYHCFPRPAGQEYLTVIADVMGKGTGAALLTASLHAYMHAYSEEGSPLKELVERLNRAIISICDGQIFVTFFALLFDTLHCRAYYCNAGHNPVVLARAGGEVELLREGGPLLGFSPDVPYAVSEISLRQGDVLALYTDGLTEMENPAGEMLGLDFLSRFMMENRHLSCPEISASLLREVHAFRQNAPPHDDLTGIFFKCGIAKKPVDI